MEQHANLSNQSGFTLIEFCIAVVIMMVGLLGLLQAVNYATVVNLGTTLRNEAVYLADEQLVPVKTFAFERVTSSSYLVNRKTRGGFNNYSVVRTVTSPSTTSRNVSVRVVWRYKGNKQSHTISGLVSN